MTKFRSFTSFSRQTLSLKHGNQQKKNQYGTAVSEVIPEQDQ
jgi:hypothetical protein